MLLRVSGGSQAYLPREVMIAENPVKVPFSTSTVLERWVPSPLKRRRWKNLQPGGRVDPGRISRKSFCPSFPEHAIFPLSLPSAEKTRDRKSIKSLPPSFAGLQDISS